jgi:FkbM family methyltransferase
MNDKLIFDIGFHRGEDAALYLREGYTVVAVEANPLLVDKGKKSFHAAIKRHQLTLLNIGIGTTSGKQEFWINDDKSEWSSFDKSRGCRNNSACHSAIVPTTRLESLFDEFGIPYYLKIDIEGNDVFCLRDIRCDAKPRYVSCEACHIDWLEILAEKGYSSFKIINQLDGFEPLIIEREKSAARVLRNRARWKLLEYLPGQEFPCGSSGPFGKWTKGQWMNLEDARMLYSEFYGNGSNKPLNGYSWFDFHATY